MSRKKSREYAFRLVFEKFFHEPEMEYCFQDEDFVLDDSDKEFANQLIGGINENYENIREIIKRNIVGYEIDSLYKVDLAILMVAVFEIKYLNENPPIVINEAVELSKKYSTDKSFSFVNGVLAKVLKDE